VDNLDAIPRGTMKKVGGNPWKSAFAETQWMALAFRSNVLAERRNSCYFCF
jgi:hypothetical protein